MQMKRHLAGNQKNGFMNVTYHYVTEVEKYQKLHKSSLIKVEASDWTPCMFRLWVPNLAVDGDKPLIHSKELDWT